MIFLNDNSVNYCVFTLLENSQLYANSGITPNYLFNFYSPATNEGFYFVGTNLSASSSQTRYDAFNITLTGLTNVNLSASTIYLRPGMFFDYVIYEQVPQYNFDPTQTVGIVETGKVMYSSHTISQEQIYTIYTGNTPQNRIIYTTY